ncbi:ensconsin-like isoform X1 [Branchiostoma floridae]|uniref:Ensconsin-like isoform X1 n=1 Tax=Branchiostoma floridae TaxID=7739 RepID=A0A9J7MGL1_BRAFL|nr:ensconsin-like isoform X1 [Branchiostoma floridae]
MSYQDPRLPSRPPSEQLVDLHVYVVPGDVWVEHLRLVYNEAVKDTVSAGFVRVFPDVTIYNLREEIEEQLGYDVIPKEFIFLRGVGRALTQVKGRQEFQLKVKNFVPPLASSPEIYVIEGSLVHQSPRALPAIGHRYSEPGTSRSTASDNPLDRSQVFSDPPPGRSHSQRRKDFEPLRKSDEYDSQRTDHDRLGNHGRRRDDHREAFVTQADAAKLLSTNLDQTAFSPDNDDSGSSPQNLKDSGYNTTPRDSQEYDDKTPKRPSERSPDGRSRVRSRTYPSPSPERTSYPQTRPQSRSTPLSATPPASPLTSNPSPGQKVHKLDRSRAGSRAATYTSQTNEDSGIADSTPPEEDNRTLDRRKREEERQRREAEERRREEEDRREEEERRHREEEERRRREEEERWRRQREKEAQSKKGRSRSNSPEHQVARFPSPPPLELPSSRDGGKTQTSESPKKSTRSKRRSSGAGADREDLLEELERIREERKNAEKKREEMVKKAKQLQNKTQHRRNQARDIWKKRYFEEKKKTTPLEENCNRLRAELDMTHRKLMSKLEGDKDGKRRFNVNTDPPSSKVPPSYKNNQKVQLTRIQHELDDLKEKVENAKMKLTSEMKLRNQAETELRALRAELTQKKIHAALTRNQQSNIMHTMDKVQPGYMPAKVMPPT